MLNQHMLSYMLNQSLKAGGGSPAALEDIASGTDTGNQQTYSATASLSYSAGDQLVIMAAGRAANNAWPADQVELSIDSTECTILSSSTEGNAYGCWTAIGVLEATSSGSSFACFVDVSPTDTGDAAANCTIVAAVVSSSGVVDSALCDQSVGSVTLNQETDGYVLAIATSFDVTPSTDPITWTNITKLGQSNLENNSPSWAGNTTSSTGSLTIDADDSNGTAAISAVSFSEAAGASIQTLGFVAPVTLGTPSYVGSASASGSSSLSLTGITGLAEGDVVVACLSDDNNTVSVTSSGWTSIASGNTNSITHAFVYKVMGATPDTSITTTGTVDALTATAFRDVDYESISSVGTDGGSTFGSPPSATVTQDDSIVLMLACLDDDDSTIATPSTGYTVAAENGRRGGSNAQMYKTGVSTGTESPSAYTWSSPDAQICATVVLKSSGPAERQAAGFILPPDFSYIGNYINGDILTATQTFSSVTFGTTTGQTKRIVIAVGYNTGTVTTITISSATIGGTAATIIQSTATSGNERVAIIYADVASGTNSGDIVINYSSAFTDVFTEQGTAISIYQIADASSISSVTSSESVRNNSLGTHTTTTSTASGSIVISSCGIGGWPSSIAQSVDWTGATEDFESLPKGTLGSASTIATGASTVISLSPDTTYGILVTASFNS